MLIVGAREGGFCAFFAKDAELFWRVGGLVGVV